MASRTTLDCVSGPRRRRVGSRSRRWRAGTPRRHRRDAIDAAPSTATRQRSDAAQVCYKEGHEHWCVGGQRAIAAGLTEFCGCQHIYAGCQAFPADPAATPPPTDED